MCGDWQVMDRQVAVSLVKSRQSAYMIEIQYNTITVSNENFIRSLICPFIQ